MALPVSTKPKFQSEEVDSLAPIIKADQKLPARRGRPPKLPPVVQTAQIGDLSNPDQDEHDTGPKHPASDCALDKRPIGSALRPAQPPTGNLTVKGIW
ncbi:hypothetical protein PtB15_2B355 [Puccinia triticina]|nr:hypothetical protein PtB15_2B355 [Puccinia triticina]